MAHEAAILGYACRLPAASDADAFWRLLTEGRCAIGEIGPDRWSKAAFLNPDRTAPGSTYSAAAGLVEDVLSFDAGFFGVSPREAVQLDPQQRMILQTAWEALEHAGLTPARLKGERTGVYIGCSGLDYGNLLHADPAASDSQFMTGNTLSIIANRLAHFIDAQGPSYVIDTACSSSLFAFHAACEAIQAGEIDIALVGGVNLLMSPMPFVGFSRAGMLSPTGLCKPFDASADGYVRAEGCVVFVLCALDVAQESGDRVRGMVVGTAVNSDGRAGALSVPNGARQADLMRRVYGGSGASPDDLAFVEAHGTGTAVGDPIEARAIGEALGRARSAPLPIGSVKSNIGHLEPASGLAGLLKAQMALERGVLPGTLHLRQPNPEIPFSALNLTVAREAETIAPRDRPWLAGVNSFGFGGANAHVAIRQPTAEEAAPRADAVQPDGQAPLILSAASEEALRALAALWRDRLARAGAAEGARLVATAAHRRARLQRRLVVCDTGPAAQAAALSAFLEGRDEGRWAVESAAGSDAGAVAFVFAGNGAQWPGMGLSAYGADAAFRDSFDETAALVAAEGGPDLAADLRAADLAKRLHEATVAQPLMLALQIAVVDALAARGVRPAAVAGHSVGEVAAAWAAGALTRAQAARLAMRRARRQRPLLGAGAMAAMLVSAEATQELIAESGIEGLEIAADNSPRGATVSGEPAAIEALLALARRRRIATRRLRVDYPFHSVFMERIRDGLMADLAALEPEAGHTPFVSTTDGGVVPGEALDADYWWRNARQPVRFREAVLALGAMGARVFVEIGPQPSLQNYVADTLTPTGAPFAVLPTLRRQGRDAEDLGVIAARVLAAGGAVDEAAMLGAPSPYAAEGPAYPWRRQSYRFDIAPDALNTLRHPAARGLLGWRARGGEGPWRLRLDLATHGWLADHAVDGVATAPGAALAEIALAAGAEALGDGPIELVDFDILRAATLTPGQPVDLRTTVEPCGAVRIESRQQGGAWSLSAAGALRRAQTDSAEEPPAPAASPAAAGASVEPDARVYAGLSAMGLDYGPAFRRAGAPEMSGARAAAALAPGRLGAAGPWILDPSDLDAAFHVAAPLFAQARPDIAAEGLCLVPVRFGRLSVSRPGVPVASVEARATRTGVRGAAADFTLRGADGAVVARLTDARFAAVRLRRRRAAAVPFWRVASQPLRADPQQRAATPRSWADAPVRLAALGLTTPTAPEPDAGALVLDAICRRAAWEAALALAPDGGVAARARRSLPAGLRRALTRGLGALGADGAYDAERDAVDAAPPAPEIEALAAALAEAAPERAADLVEALRLCESLRRGADGVVRPGRTAAPPVLAALDAIAPSLAADWPADAPFDVLVIGTATPAALAALEAGASRLATAPAEALDAANGALRAALEAGPYDVVLLAEALDALDGAALRRIASAMAPAGLFLALEPDADLFRGMLCDLAEAPAPLGAGHAERLASAGFADAAASRLAAPETPCWALSARGPARAVEPAAETATPAMVGFGDAAAATLDGLAPGATAAVHLDALVPRDAPDRSSAVACGVIALRDAARRLGPDGRLTVVAPGALTGNDPAAAALARTVRVMANERPAPPVAVIDPSPGLAAGALEAALRADGEPERAISAAGWAAPRVTPAPDVAERAERAAAGPEPMLALRPDAAGGLETMRWRALARRAPGPGEVEIAVHAAGLNFRDVMWAMGALPEEAIEDGFSGAGLGMECAGVVCRAGPGARLREGDAVVAFAAGALASHVTVAEGAAAPLPAGADFAAWATLPVAFGTAWRGLADLGALRAGETALIHGGAGGVGLAALQIARSLGARALVTAGSPERRRLACALGAEAAFDSRSVAFADAVMAATGGRGVDVALNSLSGEAMERTLGCVAAFGRFVELGKRDFYANTRIGLRPLRRNVSYFGVDLDAMLAARPDLGRSLLADVAERAAAGEFRPLPHQRFAAGDAVAAFRLMQRSGHVGKIVIAPPDAPEPVAAAPLAREDGAYLVVGGARGFGARFAERLVARGARRIWLTGRTGVADDAALAAMRAAGARVEVAACDAADDAATAALLARIDAEGAPLRGVAHAAMALDDGLLDGLDAARIAASLRPKLAGAAALDRLTRGRPLDHFVLFSSIAAWFGNPGQASYVAANAALESIAQSRRAAGLPALAAAFGPIADAGVLADDAQARERLERRGAGMLSAEAALDALEAALAGAGPADAALGVAPMRWGALAADLPIMRAPLFSRLDLSAEAVAANGATSLAELLAGLDDSTAVAKLAALLRSEAAAILRQPVEEIDPSRPLADLGFDSLMGMELKLSAEEKFGAALSGLSLSDGATLRSLAARMVADMRGAADESEGAPEISALLSRHMAPDRQRAAADALAAAAGGDGAKADGIAPIAEGAEAAP